MCWAWLDEDLGAGAPDHDKTINFFLITETVDVGTDAIKHFALTCTLVVVVAREVTCVLLFKSCLHGNDVAKNIRDGFNVLALLENTCTRCSNVGVIGKDVPCAPDNVVEACKWNKILHEWGAVVGALAQADGAHLGHGSNWLALAALG